MVSTVMLQQRQHALAPDRRTSSQKSAHTRVPGNANLFWDVVYDTISCEWTCARCSSLCNAELGQLERSNVKMILVYEKILCVEMSAQAFDQI
jgi:hypothetical protein